MHVPNAKVLISHNSDQFHKMFKNSGMTKFYIKKFQTNKQTFNVIITILKEHNYQIFIFESKYTTPFKFVLYGSNNKSAEECFKKEDGFKRI